MAAGSHGVLAIKAPEAPAADGGQDGLRRSVGALDLTALGIGTIIGTGIFVIIGEAIGKTGPSIVLSFVLAGVTCIFSALSYAELAAAVKLGVLALFIVVGATAFHSANLHPFTPKGVSGVSDAAALIFFAYIGFDAVSTSSEEARNPGRDLPRAIIGSLLIATVIYIAVALVTTGLLPFGKLTGSESPLADALKLGGGFSWGADVLSFGALVAITSVVLSLLYGQSRIMYSMCRDGLLPPALARLSSRRRVPVRINLLFGGLATILAALLPIKSLSELVNIGTLFAFLLVNAGVIILRRTRPELQRPFRVPLVPVVLVIGAALCIYLMSKLAGVTWLRFGIWMVVGVLIYAVYGYRHSRLRPQPS